MIRLEQIQKTYCTGRQSYHALKGINLDIAAGEMVALVGASGSGKTTTMNIIGLLDQADSGRYQLDGHDIEALTPDAAATIRNQQIGFIFQSFYLLPKLSALDNVCLPLMYRDRIDPDSHAKATALLEKVGMLSYQQHYPDELSGGQQQRVAIARALVTDPKVILADEPTGALDSKTSEQILSLLHELNREEGRTIVIVTHDQAVAKQCQRVVTIADGVVI